MRKLIYCFLCFVGVTMFMDSCKSEQAKESFNDSIQGTNDSIQGTFFGVPFGAEKQELVNKFAEKKLIPNMYISTEDFLAFQPKGGQSYTFGGLHWECLNVYLSDGKFYSILFYNTLKDKAEAIHEGQSLYNIISAKYNLAKEEPKDSTTYLIYRGKSKKENKREVAVYVIRYEAVDKTICYGTILQYMDGNFEAAVSEEL